MAPANAHARLALALLMLIPLVLLEETLDDLMAMCLLLVLLVEVFVGVVMYLLAAETPLPLTRLSSNNNNAPALSALFHPWKIAVEWSAMQLRNIAMFHPLLLLLLAVLVCRCIIMVTAAAIAVDGIAVLPGKVTAANAFVAMLLTPYQLRVVDAAAPRRSPPLLLLLLLTHLLRLLAS